MELNRHLRDLNLNAAPPAAPHYLLYIPPGGRAVHCPDIDQAKDAAENLAAEKPGRTVAVYQLVGYAHKPIEKPKFQDSEQAIRELLDAPKDDDSTQPVEGTSGVERSDLTPEELARLRAIGNAMNDDQIHDEGELR
jgi:hypothetical protein